MAISVKVESAYHSVMRRAIDNPRRGADPLPLSTSGSLLEDIADTADSVDELAVERVIHFRAQPAHMDFDHVRVAFEVDVPDLLSDQRARQHVARATQ